MKLKIFKYKIPFRKPFKSSKGTSNYREGLILRAKDKDVKAFGESAPLFSFSKESLKECLEQIIANQDSLKTFVETKDHEVAYDILESLNLCASAEFGFDTLRHDFIAQKHDLSWDVLFGRTFQEQIDVNAVLGGDHTKEVMERFHELVDSGYTTFKVKVGLNEKRELELLRLIRSEHQNIDIRLDANAAWTVNEASRWVESFAEYNIEYIEQPVATIDEMKEVVKTSPVKIAADESVRTYEDAKRIIEEKAAHILAIKPMLFGHFKRLIVTKDLADTHGIELVLTSALESGIGIKMCSILASFLGSELMAHGFSTDTLFIEGLLKRSPVQHNKFIFPDDFGLGIGSKDINRNLLEEVST